MRAQDLKHVEPYVYEIPREHRHDMRVPARFYADADILEAALDDKSLDQLVNSATLPGIVKYALAMPDIHQGYGFPIGGVVATRVPDGVISPGGVGYDINCGVRLLGSHLHIEDLRPHLDGLATRLQQHLPAWCRARRRLPAVEQGVGGRGGQGRTLGAAEGLRHGQRPGAHGGKRPYGRRRPGQDQRARLRTCRRPTGHAGRGQSLHRGGCRR